MLYCARKVCAEGFALPRSPTRPCCHKESTAVPSCASIRMHPADQKIVLSSAAEDSMEEDGSVRLGTKKAASSHAAFSYSSLIPAFFTKGPQRWLSCATSFPNAAASSPIGSIPLLSSSVRNARSRIISTISAWSRSVIAGGVPAGAESPYQPDISKPLRVLSDTLGNFGRRGDLCGFAIANARSRPALTCGMTTVKLSNESWTVPAIRSCSAGPDPL